MVAGLPVCDGAVPDANAIAVYYRDREGAAPSKLPLTLTLAKGAGSLAADHEDPFNYRPASGALPVLAADPAVKLPARCVA